MAEPERQCPDDATRIELALGELTGRDRAQALAHVLACRTCRQQVGALVEITEQILLAAPEAEPPVGFETGVIHHLTAEIPPRRQRRWFLFAAAAVAVIVLAVTLRVGPAGHDRTELVEAAMITPAGRDVGRAWRYEAHPSWVLISVPGWQVWNQTGAPPRGYRLRARLDDRTSVDLGAITFANQAGAWGTTIGVAASRIRSVTVTDATGRIWCRGEF